MQLTPPRPPQTSITPLRHLRTLILRRWPYYPGSDVLSELYGGEPTGNFPGVYTHLLQRIVQEFFTAFASFHPSSSSSPAPPSQLALVAFAFPATDSAFAKIDFYQPFLKGVVTDPFGNRTTCAVRVPPASDAVRVSPELLASVVPDSEVLRTERRGRRFLMDAT